MPTISQKQPADQRPEDSNTAADTCAAGLLIALLLIALLRGQVLLVDRSHHDIIRIDHFVEVNLGYF